METMTMPSATEAVSASDFGQLYEQAFPAVAQFVRKMNGTYDDACDIFQDACVVLFEKDNLETTPAYESREAYLIGIAKHLWVRKYKLNKRTVALSDWERSIEIPEDYYPAVNILRMTQLLEIAGRKCLDVLSAFYYPSKDREKHACLGYGSEHSASVQKYKCMEKLRNFIKRKSMRYEDFLE